METETFIEFLRANKNPKKISGMEKYMRNQFKFLGIQAAERRELARLFLNQLTKKTRERWKNKSDSNQSVVGWETLFFLWELPEREFQLVGIDYLKRVQEYFVLEDLKHLKQLVLTKSWWDTVDSLAKNVGTIVSKEPKLTETMRDWSVDSNLWIRRVSILHQLSLKEKTNKELLAEVILNNVDDEEFFIRKAIGWALREYAKTNEQWVVDFVEINKEDLSPLSYREATKNIR
ncbi:MAG TPA: DNA alkylation repair protein [Atopostipes sp.]|nr:DNA alkylation repair protein [Atopostipes sp.]